MTAILSNLIENNKRYALSVSERQYILDQLNPEIFKNRTIIIEAKLSPQNGKPKVLDINLVVALLLFDDLEILNATFKNIEQYQNEKQKRTPFKLGNNSTNWVDVLLRGTNDLTACLDELNETLNDLDEEDAYPINVFNALFEKIITEPNSAENFVQLYYQNSSMAEFLRLLMENNDQDLFNKILDRNLMPDKHIKDLVGDNALDFYKLAVKHQSKNKDNQNPQEINYKKIWDNFTENKTKTPLGSRILEIIPLEHLESLASDFKNKWDEVLKYQRIDYISVNKIECFQDNGLLTDLNIQEALLPCLQHLEEGIDMLEGQTITLEKYYSAANPRTHAIKSNVNQFFELNKLLDYWVGREVSTRNTNGGEIAIQGAEQLQRLFGKLKKTVTPPPQELLDTNVILEKNVLMALNLQKEPEFLPKNQKPKML